MVNDGHNEAPLVPLFHTWCLYVTTLDMLHFPSPRSHTRHLGFRCFVFLFIVLLVNGPHFLSLFLPLCTQDEREIRETVKREQDEAYRVSLEADRKKVSLSNKSKCLTCITAL